MYKNINTRYRTVCTINKLQLRTNEYIIHFWWQSELKPFFQLRIAALFSNDGGWGWYAEGTSWLPSAKALPFSQTYLYYQFDNTDIKIVVASQIIAKMQQNKIKVK